THGDHGLRHDLVDVHALRRPVLRDHFLRDVREQHHAVLVVLVPLLDDEARGADALHDAHRLHDVRAAVDERNVLAHDFPDCNVVSPSCSSAPPAGSSACRNTPTAYSTSICTAIPVSDFCSHSPTSLMCSRIRRLRCTSTSMSSTSRG